MSSAHKLKVTLPCLVAMTAALLWLWICYCTFPLHVWNDVRLEPSFLLDRGLPVYPSPGIGAVTTWIYGPLPVFLLWPATLASNAASALLIAGGINLAFTAGVVIAVCLAWPGRAVLASRVLAAALSLALWPAASFNYLQADNYSVAFGLLSLLTLAHTGSTPPGKFHGNLAALFAVAAMMCKQTSAGLALAELIWLGWLFGWRTALIHAVRIALLAAALGLGAILVFGFEGLWFNLVQIPGRLPWTSEVQRRLWDLSPLLAVHVGIPAIGLWMARRHLIRRDSTLSLPALAWICTLPAGLAGILTLGGTLNSLQSLLYLLPAVAVCAPLNIEERFARFGRWLPVGIALIVVTLIGTRLMLDSGRPFKPVIGHIRQGEVIAQQFKGRVWFPWNPVLTIYSDDRFYHAEDGIYVRFLTGHALDYVHARAHLPENWQITALPAGGSDWGIALNLHRPPEQKVASGWWSLYLWNSPAP